MKRSGVPGVSPCRQKHGNDSPSSMRTTDAADAIMDNIDVQLINLNNRKRSTLMKHRLSKDERDSLSEQGVVFDTGDETNSELKLALENLRITNGDKSRRSKERAGDGDDTGLGSGSVDFSDNETADTTALIEGKVDMFEDSEYSDNVPCSARGSEITEPPDSARSNTLEQQINDRYHQAVANFVEGRAPSNKPVMNRPVSRSDLESVRTEYLERVFQKCLVTSSKQASIVDGDHGKIVTGSLPRRPRRQRGSVTSDHDSVRTEDFENQFQKILAKEMKVMPRKSSFDRFLAESDAETANSYATNNQRQKDFVLAASRDPRQYHDGSHNDDYNDVGPASETVSVTESHHRNYNNQPSLRDVPSPSRSNLSDRQRTSSSSLSKWMDQESTTLSGRTPSLTTSFASFANTITELRAGSRSTEKSKASSRSSKTLELGEEEKAMGQNMERVRRELELGLLDQQRGAARRACSSTKPAPRASSTDGMRQKEYGQLAISNKVDWEVSLQLQAELAKVQSEIKQLIHTKQDLQNEVEDLEQSISQQRQQARRSDVGSKKLDDKHAELDSANRELEELTSAIEQSRRQLDKLERSGQKLQELGYTTEEVTHLISEREELLDRVRSMEAVDRERDELKKQLSMTTEEQKRNRDFEASLKEELRIKTGKLDELEGEKDELASRVSQLETTCRRMENDHAESLKIKNEEYETLRNETKDQLARSKEIASREVKEVRQNFDSVADQLAQARHEADAKKELNDKLRDQVEELCRELSKQNQLRDKLVDENKIGIQTITKDKEVALNALRAQIADEKRKALEEQAREHHLVMQQQDKKYTEQLGSMQAQIDGKNMELQSFKDHVERQDSWIGQLSARIKEEAYQKLQELINEERQKWDDDKEVEIEAQQVSLRNEMEHKLRQLHEELEHERSLVQTCRRQMDSLRMELEVSRQENQQAYRDKLEMAHQMKEASKLEIRLQQDVIKGKIQQEVERTVDKLNNTVRQQQEELEQVGRAKRDLELRLQEAREEIEKHDKTILDELNAEYHRTVQSLHKHQRNSSTTGRSMSPTRNINRNLGTVQSSISSTIASLKSAYDELRMQMSQLQQEADHLRQVNMQMDKEKREELNSQKEKLHLEKQQALELLKDRLIKDHIEELGTLQRSAKADPHLQRALYAKDKELKELHRCVNIWKEETEKRLAEKLHKEMTIELEKRLKRNRQQQLEMEQERAAQQVEIENLRNSQSPSSRPPAHGSLVRAARPSSPGRADDSAAMIAQLQARIKRLQMENTNLSSGKKMTGSVPDLTAVDGVHQTAKREDVLKMRQLELSAQRAENRASLAEERANKNDQLLNQKLLELSRLQGTLTQQTKELMQLQRAYSQLQNVCRPISPSHSKRRSIATADYS